MYNCNLYNWPPEVILITVFIRTISSCLVFLCDVSTFNILNTEFIQYVHAANIPFSYSFIYGLKKKKNVYIYILILQMLLFYAPVFAPVWIGLYRHLIQLWDIRKCFLSYQYVMFAYLWLFVFTCILQVVYITPTYTRGTYRTEWHSSCG